MAARPVEAPAKLALEWPTFPTAWEPTRVNLHKRMQIVGKIQLALAPSMNHTWQVAFDVGARGLETKPMPFEGQLLKLRFDFIDHTLVVETSRGDVHPLPLDAGSVASFYEDTMEALATCGVEVGIWTTPVEVEDRLPFERDVAPRPYEREAVERFWRALVQAHRVLAHFRGGFVGKASPVHFFWGGMDLAASRYSGRRAPPHPGSANVARRVMLEAYSHEVASAGFWPGAGEAPPIFYAYAYPEPDGYCDADVAPAAAHYDAALAEFVLPYERVRASRDPDATLLAFLDSTYTAAATLGGWDRAALERSPAPGAEL